MSAKKKTARGRPKKVQQLPQVVVEANSRPIQIRFKVPCVNAVYDQRPTAQMSPLRLRFTLPEVNATGVIIPLFQHEAWFMRQNSDHFMHYTKKWNEDNLHVVVPALDDYEDWLNYFKGLSPTVIRRLAVTGLDFLPTDGYSALSRWHDIITHPGRIDKIYQAGLTKKRGKEHKTIVELAQSNDRLGVLQATRDEIANKLQKGAGARDTAALARELTEVMTQIADYEKRQGPKKATKLGSLLADVDLRKRPSENGKGARHTSFKSRVTIKDVEAA